MNETDTDETTSGRTISADSPALDRKRRQQERAAKKAGLPVAGADGVPPLTEAAALGLPEEKQAGGLRLEFRAPVMAKAAAVYGAFLQKLPDVIVFAALGDRQGVGVDFDKTAAFATRFLGEKGVTYTPADARAAFLSIGWSLLEYEPEGETARRLAAEARGEEFMPHPLDAFAEILAALTIPHTAGLTPEAIPGLLRENLRPADLADLARRILDCLCGVEGGTAYEGDAAARMF